MITKKIIKNTKKGVIGMKKREDRTIEVDGEVKKRNIME